MSDYPKGGISICEVDSPEVLQGCANKPVAAAHAPSAHPARIAALDFTKGILVLVMVLYHWLNYFAGAQGFFYRYLSFLPPSFICITGFLISRVYLTREQSRLSEVRGRLAVRGLKILGIFSALNVALGMLRSGAESGYVYSTHSLASIFVTGNMPHGRVVAFYILVPISYVLLLSSCILLSTRNFHRVFTTVAALTMILMAWLSAQGAGSTNLEMVFIGCVGVLFGFVNPETLNQVFRHRSPVLLLYLLQQVAITIWNVPFALQVSGVILTLALIFAVGNMVPPGTAWVAVVTNLGKYSLFGYIVQIAILQCLHRLVPHSSTLYGAATSLACGAVLTVAAVEIVDRLRISSRIVDKIYRAVFA